MSRPPRQGFRRFLSHRKLVIPVSLSRLRRNTAPCAILAWPRMGAVAVDGVLVYALWTASRLAASGLQSATAPTPPCPMNYQGLLGRLCLMTGSPPPPGLSALLAAICIGYFVLFEWRFGRTPGKVLFNVAVVSSDGKPVSLVRASLRHLLRPFDAALSIACYMDDPNQGLRVVRLGDALAGTRVGWAGHREGRLLGLLPEFRPGPSDEPHP